METSKKLPLYKHKNGQWCKRIGGRLYYFGTDQAEAMLSYAKSKANIAAGRGKVVQSGRLSLHRLADLYYDHKRQQVGAGEFSEKSLSNVKKSLERLIGIMGRTSNPEMWFHSDYDFLRTELMKPSAVARSCGRAAISQRSHATVDCDIRIIKAFLNWLNQVEYIENKQHKLFLKRASSKMILIERSRSTVGPLGAKDILAIISRSTDYFLPVLMLGINGGMGAADIAKLTIDQFSDTPWLVCPRMKTGAHRKIWLWPETQKAIEEYLSRRKEPYRNQWRHIAFLTSHRSPWVNGLSDSASNAFRLARKDAGLKRGSFYDLRRTFQTIGDETMDFPAVSYCMGHLPRADDMAARYRRISDDRIKNVCSSIRDWLYGFPGGVP